MKQLITILLLIFATSMSAQNRDTVAIKLNTNGTKSYFFVYEFQDGIRDENGGYVMPRVDSMKSISGFVWPNSVDRFVRNARGIYVNFPDKAEWTGLTGVPATFPSDPHTHTISEISNASTVGASLLGLSNPASTSLISVAPNGTVNTRTLAQAQNDLGIDLKANINSPAFTGTPTGIGIPVYARVTGSNATTTGQALVDIPGLSIPLATNAVYEISGMLSVSTSNVTTGVQYGLNYSVAGGAVEAQLSGSLTSTATKTERISTLNTASTAFLTTSNQTGGIIIRGIITTGANAGNLTVKHLKVTSGTSTIFINSVLKVTRIQ